MRRLRRRPSPGVILGIIAIVLASTGSAIAASQITSKQIKNGTIQLTDISKKARVSLEGGRGPQGGPGPGGPAGPPGPPGPAGATKVVVRQGTPFSIPFGMNGTSTASCNPGERAVGGGNTASDPLLAVSQSLPIGGSTSAPPTGWRVDAHNTNTAGAANLTAVVVCASP
jgi:hypothetical protein